MNGRANQTQWAAGDRRKEERRLLGPVIQRKLGVTDTLCQAACATFGALDQAGSVGHVVA